MIFQCNKCYVIHYNDDSLECTCGSEDVTILEYCDECFDLFEIDEIRSNYGICYDCLSEIGKDSKGE